MTDVPPATPRPAASLILLRDGPDGLEALIGRRAFDIPAFPGRLSFPGGKIEAVDRLSAGGDARRAAAHAALRETFEETGVLITDDGAGPPPGAGVAAARAAVELDPKAFPDLLARWDRRLGLERLACLSHWITPAGAPYRFNTWFFVAAASPAEAGMALIRAEFAELRWARPEHVLAQEGARLTSPMRGNLDVLVQSSSAETAVAAARRDGPVEGRPGPFVVG